MRGNQKKIPRQTETETKRVRDKQRQRQREAVPKVYREEGRKESRERVCFFFPIFFFVSCFLFQFPFFQILCSL